MKKVILKQRVLLTILDGYGEAPSSKGNAIKLAKTPFIDHIRNVYPHTLLKAHGDAVGTPKGTQGGSEVGHFTIGAGRIVYQALEQINQDIKSGRFFKNKVLRAALERLENKHQKNRSLHLIGMISDQGVHSDIRHLFALLKLAKQRKINNVYIHAITDGRDVPEKSAKNYIKKLQSYIKKIGVGQIVTVMGRYYAMDRDRNWKRTKKAYQLIIEGKGHRSDNPVKAIEEAYSRGDTTDYYIKPIILDKKGLIKNNDVVVFFNFRTDRARQLTEALIKPKFNKFNIKHKNINFVAFGEYTTMAPVAFPSPFVKNNLGEILSKAGMRQLRIAETEKYAHVTYFFNSQVKKPFGYEDRIVIDSPKTPSYEDKPEMSAQKLTEETCKQISQEKYDLIVQNYANPDLVGHSGNLKATIRCIEILDGCLKKLIDTALQHHYSIILTGDHGNAEQKLYPDGSRCPSHSINPVPLFLISKPNMKVTLKKKKGLKDIAPTILELMGMKKPKEMSGETLIVKKTISHS